MTYVIGAPCIDIMDRACVDECPVDCIYEGERSLYINPDECVDCGACEAVCPVDALVGVDVQAAFAFVDAVDWAFIDAGAVHDVDAGCSDHVRHSNLLGHCLLYTSPSPR